MNAVADFAIAAVDHPGAQFQCDGARGAQEVAIQRRQSNLLGADRGHVVQLDRMRPFARKDVFLAKHGAHLLAEVRLRGAPLPLAE